MRKRIRGQSPWCYYHVKYLLWEPYSCYCKIIADGIVLYVHNRPCYIGSLLYMGGLVWQKQVSMAWTSNYIPQILRDAVDHYIKSHNAPVSHPTMHHSEQKCAHLFWMVHCGMWNRCIAWFVDLVYYLSLPLLSVSDTQVIIMLYREFTVHGRTCVTEAGINGMDK